MALRSKPKTILYQFLLCSLHAAVMMLICLFWLSLGYNAELEKGFIQLSSIIKRSLLKDTADYTKDFVFIDVSKTKKLIPAKEGAGFEVITDRDKLNTFFQLINKVSNYDYEYIVCDILFDKTSAGDDKLQRTLNNTRKIVLPYSQDDKGILSPVFSNVQVGYAGYKTSSGLYSVKDFLKYELIQNQSLKGIPALVYEQVANANIEKHSGLAWINDHPSLNDIVLDLRLRNENITDKEGNSKIYSFEEMLNLLSANGSSFYKKFFPGKIIVIGDYKNDLHETAIGTQPGPLILANIYLSILYGDNLVTAGWLLYIFICFWFLSWLIFYRQPWIKKIDSVIEEIPVIGTLVEITAAVFIIWMISLVSYIWMDHYLDIVVLVVYLGLLNSVVEYIQKKKVANKSKHSV